MGRALPAGQRAAAARLKRHRRCEVLAKVQLCIGKILRAALLQATWNYERQQGLGWAWALKPALDKFKAGSYGAAIAGFNTFVKTYPKSPLAPSAQYWIGNAQYAQKDFRGAIATQRQLLAAYPDNAKVPDAMLSIASAQLDLGDGAGSRRTLEDLLAKYPKSEAAAKAKQRLGAR